MDSNVYGRLNELEELVRSQKEELTTAREFYEAEAELIKLRQREIIEALDSLTRIVSRVTDAILPDNPSDELKDVVD